VETAAQVVAKPGWFKKTITLGMAKGKTTSQARLKLPLPLKATAARSRWKARRTMRRKKPPPRF